MTDSSICLKFTTKNHSLILYIFMHYVRTAFIFSKLISLIINYHIKL